MSHAPLTLVLFWIFAAGGAAGIVLAVLTGRLRPNTLLTNAEWKAVIQLFGIVALVITMIYFQNGHLSDQAAFIYGRF